MEAVRANGAESSVFDLYWEFGTRIHHDGDRTFRLEDALQAVGVDKKFADAGEDPSWDEPIREKMNDGLSLVGDDVGTPIIAWNRDDGENLQLKSPRMLDQAVVSPYQLSQEEIWEEGLVPCS